MTENRRVVITGLGLVSPVGSAVDKAWKNIKNGQHDQSILNVLASKYYGEVNVLDFDWGAHWKRGKYIVCYSY